jgi:fluoride exporter
MTLLLVALAGGLGAATRFLVDGWVAARLRSSVPTGTVVVNVTGSLALGLLTGWALRHGGGGQLATVVGTGFLGGYTTFSTASVEAVRLARGGRAVAAFAHALGMVVLSLAAALAGLWLTGP